MAESIMSTNKLRELDSCCCDIIQYFGDLNVKIDKIIKAKNKKTDKDVVKNVENLEMINSKIVGARDEIIQLHHQISQSLSVHRLVV